MGKITNRETKASSSNTYPDYVAASLLLLNQDDHYLG